MLTCIVTVISRRGLMKLAGGKRVDADTIDELNAWYRTARVASWKRLTDVGTFFADADQIGSAVVFNIRHNRYRLITFMVYAKQKLYVKALLTHREYEREEWKKWA